MNLVEIIQLDPKDYYKCAAIWDMKRDPKRTRNWLKQIESGKRVVFVYTENGEFIGEAALVFDNGDRDYTIPGQRVCLSRMIVKSERRDEGIGGVLIDFLIEKAKGLGFSEMSLGVDKANARAQHLYEKKGFTTMIFDGADEHGEYVKLLRTL